jgi:hypothetical protein
MATTNQSSYRGLLAGIVLWSFVSLLCFWIPLFGVYYYAVDDPGLAIVVVLGIPLVALVAAMIIPALSRMGPILEPYSKERRRVLRLVAWAASAPALGAIAIIWAVIIVVIVYGMYVALGGGAPR